MGIHQVYVAARRALCEGMWGMVQLIVFLLACVAGAEATRMLARLIPWLARKPLTCPLCMGTWIGGWLWWTATGHVDPAYALAGGAAAWLAHRWASGEW